LWFAGDSSHHVEYNTGDIFIEKGFAILTSFFSFFLFNFIFLFKERGKKKHIEFEEDVVLHTSVTYINGQWAALY